MEEPRRKTQNHNPDVTAPVCSTERRFTNTGSSSRLREPPLTFLFQPSLHGYTLSEHTVFLCFLFQLQHVFRNHTVKESSLFSQSYKQRKSISLLFSSTVFSPSAGRVVVVVVKVPEVPEHQFLKCVGSVWNQVWKQVNICSSRISCVNTSFLQDVALVERTSTT